MDIYKAEKIYKEAIDLWGVDSQTNMWHEEVGELMQAISKYCRKPTPENLDHLYEEIVDVKIMTGQLESTVPEDRMKYWFDFKMERLELRINAEKERRAQFAEDLKQFRPEKYAIFQMINEIGPNPLDSQMDDLIELILAKQQEKKEREIEELF